MTSRTEDWKNKLNVLNTENDWLKTLRFNDWSEADECAKGTGLDVFGLADGTFRLINDLDRIE